MWSKFFCSLEQKNIKWITCPRLFVFCPSTVLKSNDSGHGSIIYALHKNTYTPNQCRVDCSSLFETHLVETPCNFGFSASNQICSFTNFQNEEGANPCGLTRFVYQAKRACFQHHVPGCLFSARQNNSKLQAMAASSATNYRNIPLLSKSATNLWMSKNYTAVFRVCLFCSVQSQTSN
jgi:hypothetical protein